MKTAFILLLKIVVTVFAAEFVGGIVHWLEDAYVREDTPVFGPGIARANIVHHHYPRYMTRYNWWQTSWQLVALSAIFVLLAWSLHLLCWEVWLFAFISANGNEFHKWEHRSAAENGKFITYLQKIGLLQGAKHHALHHTDPKNSHYCTLTTLLNPILDGVNFWNSLEWLLAKTLKLKRRPDTSVRGQGPGPAWLIEYRRKPA